MKAAKYNSINEVEYLNKIKITLLTYEFGNYIINLEFEIICKGIDNFEFN